MARRRTWPWMDHLTLEERDRVLEANDRKRHWEEVRAERAAIVNRGVQRAKFAAKKAKEETNV